MDAISPNKILIYVCPGTLRVAALITSLNLVFSFSAQSHEERDNPDTKEARRIVVASKILEVGLENCVNQEVQNLRSMKHLLNIGEKLINSMTLGQYAVVNSLFNT